MKFQRRKKGSATDLFYVIIGIFLVAVVGILVSAVVTRFNTQFQSMSSISVIPTAAEDASTKLTATMPNTLNGAVIFLFFAACFVAIILASLTPFHPVFFIFFMLEVILLIIFSGGLADAFQTFIETPGLATEHGQYAVIIFLFRYLPFIIAVIGFILAAVMYKVRQDQL